MAKHQKRSSNYMGKKKGGIVKLKIVVEKLQKSLLLGKKSNSNCNYCEEECEEVCDLTNCVVPEDVKEGHFAVIAADGEEPKRFVVPLSCLTHPTFLRLLEQAEEEYGFDHEGALAIPCRPSELERILMAEQWWQGEDGSDSSPNAGSSWDSCKSTMVPSC
ncbi:Auxin-responsive protein [Quillaja saponaria]|uniref:Auxin-responsive protein n=1 Tax=Quillaja saponaria TaxID=32244 RepID=A0AAD7P9W7_QUISA|nr:Auxin-responsive protein [Quillaja saponaria]